MALTVHLDRLPFGFASDEIGYSAQVVLRCRDFNFNYRHRQNPEHDEAQAPERRARWRAAETEPVSRMLSSSFKIASIEPGKTQFLDARAVGPAVITGLAVGPQIWITERVDVRDRAIIAALRMLLDSWMRSSLCERQAVWDTRHHRPARLATRGG